MKEALENFRKITSPVITRPLDLKTRDDILLADQVHQADTKARIALAEKSLEKVLELAKVAALMPAKYGHGDIGDILVRLLQGAYTNEEACREIESLIIDYSKYELGK